MALFQPLSREKIVERASARFRKCLEDHETAVLFSRYAKLMHQLEDADGDGERGVLFATEYELLDELYSVVFAEDFKAVKKMTENKTQAILGLFQEVMSAPLAPAPSEPTSGQGQTAATLTS